MDLTVTRHSERGQAGTHPAFLVCAERFWAKIASRNTGECWAWSQSIKNGYGRYWQGQLRLQAHRVAWELTHGPIPVGMQIDHICHNRACVNPAHLRLATPSQNNANRAVVKSPTGLKGVTYYKRTGKWSSAITHEGVGHHLGYFDTPEEAHEAYRAASIALNGRFANFGESAYGGGHG